MSDRPTDAELAAAIEDLRTSIRLLNRLLKIAGPDADDTEGWPTMAQGAVLAVLDVDGPLTASSIAAVELVRPQSMAQTVAGMVDAGWVAREPDPDDRRRVVLSLTDAGRDALARLRARRQAWLMAAVRDKLTDAEQRDFVRLADLLVRVARN